MDDEDFKYQHQNELSREHIREWAKLGMEKLKGLTLFNLPVDPWNIEHVLAAFYGAAEYNWYLKSPTTEDDDFKAKYEALRKEYAAMQKFTDYWQDRAEKAEAETVLYKNSLRQELMKILAR